MGRIALIGLLLLLTGGAWALARPLPATLAPQDAIVSVRAGSAGQGRGPGGTYRTTSRARRSHVGGGIHFGK